MAELTARQQFKVAFLEACVVAGIEDGDAMRIAKAAAAHARGEKQAGLGAGLATLAVVTPILGLVAALHGGRAIGQSLGTTDRPIDVASIQRQELSDAYAAATAQLHQRNLRNAAQSGPRPYRPGGRRP